MDVQAFQIAVCLDVSWRCCDQGIVKILNSFFPVNLVFCFGCICSHAYWY